jgi:hypothetical protein
MDEVNYNRTDPESRSMSIDSGYLGERDRASSCLSYDSIETELSKTDNVVDTKPSYQEKSKIIAIHQTTRQRDMTIENETSKTPTPSKYYFMLQENDKLIRSIKNS